jgi:hypothetical protein
MWRVYCTDCDESVLLDCSQLTNVVNLEPGVIAVEMRCTRGHPIPVLTGHAIGERAWTQRS